MKNLDTPDLKHAGKPAMSHCYNTGYSDSQLGLSINGIACQKKNTLQMKISPLGQEAFICGSNLTFEQEYCVSIQRFHTECLCTFWNLL